MSSIATLVPAYNAAPHIKDALDSVAAQTRLPDEIVVVDDGSTDATADFVASWAAEHPGLPLQLIRQPNGGASAARNAAILAASSELIAFLDADDLYQQDHHARLAAALEQHAQLVAAFGQQSVFTAQGEICDNFLRGKPIEQVGYEEQADGLRILTDGLWAALVQGNFIPTSGSMTRRQVVVDAGLFDTRLKTSEDRDLWLRLSRRGQLGYLPTRLARKREHEGNLTRETNRPMVGLHALAVVQKQLDNAAVLQLTAEEIIASQAALSRAADGMLYDASRQGLRTYLEARRQLKAITPRQRHAGDPRGWSRALLWSLLRHFKH